MLNFLAKSFEKLCSVFLVLFLIISCENAKTGPFYVVNSTDEDLNIIISAKTYADIFYNIKAGEEYNTGIDYYNPSVEIVKDFNSKTKSNVHSKKTGVFYTTIEKRESYEFEIINKISDDVFSAGSDKLYLYEKNNSMDEWENENKKIEIVSSEKNINVKCYTEKPFFLLEYESNNVVIPPDFKFNNNSIRIFRDQNKIYLKEY